MTQVLNHPEENQNLTLADRIREAVEDARTACQNQGARSAECAVAWDVVEELQAERSHRQAEQKSQSAFERYCQEHPEAVECLIYEI